MSVDRRQFLRTLTIGAAGLGAASELSRIGSQGKSWLNSAAGHSLCAAFQEPIEKDDRRHVRLGLAAYSLREHFEFSKGKSQKPLDGRTIDMFGFIDYCAQLGCGAELTSYFFPPDINDDYLLRIKRRAFLSGVPIVGTAIGNNFTIGKGEKLDQQIADAKRWIDRAAVMGAPHIRFFAGTRKQLESSPDNMQNAIESLQDCVDYAAQKGIFIGIENHGDLTADQVVEIVQSVKSDWFGVNLDSGNFVSDDPYRDLKQCASFAVNVQLKMKMKRPDGETYDADLPRIARILSDANYRGNVVLEFEEPDPFDHIPGVMKTLTKTFAAN